MKEFQIYAITGLGKDAEIKEIAVLVTRAMGGQKVQRSVNRHVHYQGIYLVGRHPDFYDGVDAKNTAAEDVVSRFENEVGSLAREFAALGDSIFEWGDNERFGALIAETSKDCKSAGVEISAKRISELLHLSRSSVLKNLKKERGETEKKLTKAGLTLENAKKYLAEIREEFPRLVTYFGQSVAWAKKMHPSV